MVKFCGVKNTRFSKKPRANNAPRLKARLLSTRKTSENPNPGAKEEPQDRSSEPVMLRKLPEDVSRSLREVHQNLLRKHLEVEQWFGVATLWIKRGAYVDKIMNGNDHGQNLISLLDAMDEAAFQLAFLGFFSNNYLLPQSSAGPIKNNPFTDLKWQKAPFMKKVKKLKKIMERIAFLVKWGNVHLRLWDHQKDLADLMESQEDFPFLTLNDWLIRVDQTLKEEIPLLGDQNPFGIDLSETPGEPRTTQIDEKEVVLQTHWFNPPSREMYGEPPAEK